MRFKTIFIHRARCATNKNRLGEFDLRQTKTKARFSF